MFKYLLLILLLASNAFAAFEYDGTGDSHVANNPNAGASDDFTVCWRMYSTTITSGQAIIGYGNGHTSSNGRGFNIGTNGTRSIRINNPDGSNGFWQESGTAFSDATWHHVCIVNELSSTTTRIYIDATDATSDVNVGIDPPAAQSATDDFYIGETVPENGDLGYSNFVGRIVHASYWTKALTGSEVQSMANGTTCPTDVQSAYLKVFVPLVASPATESAQTLSVTTNGDPTLVSDPTLPSCGAASSGEAERRRIYKSKQ